MAVEVYPLLARGVFAHEDIPPAMGAFYAVGNAIPWQRGQRPSKTV